MAAYMDKVTRQMFFVRYGCCMMGYGFGLVRYRCCLMRYRFGFVQYGCCMARYEFGLMRIYSVISSSKNLIRS